MQLDDHLKNLLRELGHAINDTVSESDRITGAIAGVRAHGYDIVLKLDATIGLARRDAASGQQDSRLTTLDRRFLESLRIQVDQDSFNETEPEKRAVAKLAMVHTWFASAAKSTLSISISFSRRSSTDSCSSSTI